jgi:hypothetical protein
MAIGMAKAMADGDGIDNGDGDSDGNQNGDIHSNGNNDVVVTMTDTREGCLFMCQQCAALWQGRCLASPPWAQRSVHCPALYQEGATAKSVRSIL